MFDNICRHINHTIQYCDKKIDDLSQSLGVHKDNRPVAKILLIAAAAGLFAKLASKTLIVMFVVGGSTYFLYQNRHTILDKLEDWSESIMDRFHDYEAKVKKS